MKSQYINKLHKGPERESEIDIIVGNIRKAAQTGVRIITYHCEVIPIAGTGRPLGGEAPRAILSSWKMIGRMFPWEMKAE